MSFQTKTTGGSTAKKIVTISIFVAQAMILSYFERFIPLQLVIPIPGVRIGLANIIILTAIYQLGFSMSLSITLLKCFLVGLLFGTPVTMMYSFTGSLLSLFVMYSMNSLLKNYVSPVGISVVGSIFHIIGQLTVASYIMGNSKIFFILPYLLVTGVIAGLAIGFSVLKLEPYLIKYKRYA